MTMTIASALQAYAAAGRAGPGMAARDTEGNGFAELVRDVAGQVADTMQTAENASLRAAAGTADISEVVTAVANAEATLQTVTAIRDRVIAAYQEILRMPI